MSSTQHRPSGISSTLCLSRYQHGTCHSCSSLLIYNCSNNVYIEISNQLYAVAFPVCFLSSMRHLLSFCEWSTGYSHLFSGCPLIGFTPHPAFFWLHKEPHLFKPAPILWDCDCHAPFQNHRIFLSAYHWMTSYKGMCTGRLCWILHFFTMRWV